MLGANNMLDTYVTITIGPDHSTFDCSPSSFGYPDPHDLDRLAASLHHLALCCCEPVADETGNHVAIEPVGDHEQLLGGAVWIAGEHSECAALLGTETRSRQPSSGGSFDNR
jgi:hypothetical protein